MYSSGSTASTSTPWLSSPVSSHASRSAASTGPLSVSSTPPPGNEICPEWLRRVGARWVSRTRASSGG